ncbi:hypothetical protein LSH36_115g04000 [Paralvinella palmiformis]|uniref:Golgi to ER traffic protein 4 homolog n=1 Tax=Paralvinella palmiformis TaxID=53620 RepID=A0AAD9JY16_9ANNE|nr:hypothetical protein LSH36_115g04000 [Paralvinella palmiformis]
MASGGRGVQRVLVKLERSIQEGNYYEAHQMYRTLYFRYNAQKRYTEAADLLYTGALTLLNAGQQQSGVDLAMLFIDTLEKAADSVSEDSIKKVCKLHELVDPDIQERANLVTAAIKWSRKGAREMLSGHPSLHQQLAVTLWHEKNYSQARYHFLNSSDGEGCAAMLIEYHVTLGYPSEVDLFITQAVLQYLCHRNKPTAERCLNCYTKQHPQVEPGPPYYRPLLNFLWLLLLAVEGGKVAVFTILCEQYQPSLQRDPTYNEYLDKIGQLFFGLPPPAKPQSSRLFGK